MTILVTGAAGFIGFHTTLALLNRGESVVGIDNLNDYYDVGLKHDRLLLLTRESRFRFIQADVSDRAEFETVFQDVSPQRVIHLAAQAGVRHSITHPHQYASANLVGFLNVLEACRYGNVEHLVYASTSSVYGANTTMPFSVHHPTEHPLTLYAATKKSNELMAHSYAHLYHLPVTGLRFFTVYGPWGRPDMSYFLFARAILQGQPIQVFNNGNMARDFTYIDDIVSGVIAALDNTAKPSPTWQADLPDPASSTAPYKVYNIGNSRPTNLLRFIEALEDALGVKAIKQYVPMQPGDVPATWADVSDLSRDVGYKPNTDVSIGVPLFVKWYKEYYG